MRKQFELQEEQSYQVNIWFWRAGNVKSNQQRAIRKNTSLECNVSYSKVISAFRRFLFFYKNQILSNEFHHLLWPPSIFVSLLPPLVTMFHQAVHSELNRKQKTTIVDGM